MPYPTTVTITVNRTGPNWGAAGADEAAACAGARAALGLAPNEPMTHRYSTTLDTLTVEAWGPRASVAPMGVAVTTHAEEQDWVDDQRSDFYAFGHAVATVMPDTEDEEINGGDFVQSVTQFADLFHTNPTTTV